MDTTQRWPPGWFPDPTGRHDHRWWDGAAWTGHVADAGVAAHDPLPPASRPTGAPLGAGGAAAAPAAADPLGAGTRQGRREPLAVAALVTALVGLVLVLIPVVGLLLPAAAIVLGVVALRRLRPGTMSGRGQATAGLAVGIVGTVLAGLVTVGTFALLGAGDGAFGALLQDYVACLETEDEATCQARLEDDLEDALRRALR